MVVHFDWSRWEDVLREQWAAGTSTTKIASIIGATKNAVIGKAHRLNLERRPNPVVWVRPAKAQAAPKSKAYPKPRPEPKPKAPVPIASPLVRDFNFFGKAPPKSVEKNLLAYKAVVAAMDPALFSWPKRLFEDAPRAKFTPHTPPRSRTCQWIDGDGRPYTMCGKPSVSGCYCGPHSDRCYWRKSSVSAIGDAK